MTLLLMAAGSGSRYGKLKQFDDLGPQGEFLMEFSIYDAIKNGFDHVVLITKEENVDFLRDHLSQRLPKNVKLDVLAQKLTDLPEGKSFTGERKPWGTSHAVWTARNVIQGPFAVLNADDFYGANAFGQAASFVKAHQGQNVYAIVGYTLEDTLSEHGSVSRGVCQTDGVTLLAVDERTKLERKGDIVIDLDTGLEFSGKEQVSMNFWICRPNIFAAIENGLNGFLNDPELTASGELYIPTTVKEMVKKGETEVKVIPSGSEWFGVTYASDREYAVDCLKQKTEAGEYPSPLWT